jgi:GTP-binding protein
LSTPQLTRTLIDAVSRQSPARSGIFRPKLRYAHQGGRNPPVIVIHGNALDKVQDSYRRYLEHVFREVFKLQGTPLRIQFNVSKNPFADKKAPEQNRRKPKAEEKPRPKAKPKTGTAVVKTVKTTKVGPKTKPGPKARSTKT